MEEVPPWVFEFQQGHLAETIPSLSPQEKKILLQQLHALSPALLQRQREILHRQKPTPKVEPIPEKLCIKKEQAPLGVMPKSKIGCLLLAGGEGSRFGLNQPKALFQISPVKHKSLLQLFCEKVVAASKKLGYPVPLGIVVSPRFASVMQETLQQNHCYGLQQTQISLMTQKVLPYLDEKENWFLSDRCHIAMGPDGNGDALIDFYLSGVWQKWQMQGIELIHVLPIDNPLSKPADPSLMFLHEQSGCELCLYGCKDVMERDHFGRFALMDQKLSVCEYTQTYSRKKILEIVNTGMFSCQSSLIKKVGMHLRGKLPWHAVQKTVQKYHHEQKSPIQAWKFEKYIFEQFYFADSYRICFVPQKEDFAPLKQKEGTQGIQKVQHAMREEATLFFKKHLSKKCCGPIQELDPLCYYFVERLDQAIRDEEGYVTL